MLKLPLNRREFLNTCAALVQFGRHPAEVA